VSPPAPVPAPAPLALKAPAAELAEVYLAVLSDPKTSKPLLLATAGRHADRMQVRTLDPSIRVAGRDLELWALPAGGVPTSLGLVGDTERSTVKLAAVASRSLANVPTLAVSLEPKGGSPTGRVTGPVLAVGPCIKFW
jgi:anti-sigma-K factor RskA